MLSGDPFKQVANVQPVKMPKVRVRVVSADFFIGGGRVPAVGDIVELDKDLARALVSFGRAAFLD